MEELLKLYRISLRYFDCEEDADGYVVSTFRKERDKLKVSGKDLVLPYLRYLENPSENRLVYHPLPEDFTKGPSGILEALKDNLTDRLNTNVFAMLLIIVNIAKNPKLVKKQDVDVKELAAALGGTTTKATLDKFTKLIKTAAADQEKKSGFVKFFLRQGKSIGNIRFSRVCVTAFPFYSLLTEDKPVMLDVEITREERAAFRKLIEYIFPNIDKQDSFSQGSDNKLCPYLDSLVRGSSMVVSVVNHTANTLKDLLGEGISEYLINTDFCSVDLSSWINKWNVLPPQSGNEGSSKAGQQAKSGAEFQLPDRSSLAAPRKLAGSLDSDEDRRKRDERRPAQQSRTDQRTAGSSLARALAESAESKHNRHGRGHSGYSRDTRGRDDRYYDDRDRDYDRRDYGRRDTGRDHGGYRGGRNSDNLV